MGQSPDMAKIPSTPCLSGTVLGATAFRVPAACVALMADVSARSVEFRDSGRSESNGSQDASEYTIMIRASSVLKLITILLFLSVFLFFGCTDKSDDTLIVLSEETESVSTLDAVPVANLEERTFSKLRAAFPGPLLDENLKTLQTLANSDIYLEFLSRVSKQIKPFQTFDEFLDTTPLDAEKEIRPILKQHLPHLIINDQDIAGFHKLATTDQSTAILINLNLHLNPKPPHIKEAEARAIKNAPFFRWFPPKEIEPHVRQAFWDAFVKFVEDATETARKEIQNTLHEHGQDEGLIWLAIQEPRILGVILNTFINPLTPVDFLRWIAPEGQEN